MNAYNDASLIVYPSGYKESKIYAQKPIDGTGDLTFARATTKTYIDANGDRQTAAINVMPVSYEGGGCGKFNFEPQRTNLLLNSDTLVTQNITTSATSYTLSFEGTGTVTLSGTYAGSLVGTGVTPADRVNLIFTATAGTLTLTVTGSVIFSQCEAGSYETSLIPTSGTTVTRVEDKSSTTGLSSVIGQAEGVLYAEFSPLGLVNAKNLFVLYQDANNRLGFYTRNDNQLWAFMNSSGVSQFDMSTGATVSVGSISKVAFAYKVNDVSIFVNGVEVMADTSVNVPSSLSQFTFNLQQLGAAFGAEMIINEAQLYKTRLDNATLATLTTL